MSAPRQSSAVNPIPFARPELRDTSALAGRIQAILDTGLLTNGPQVETLEREFAAYVGTRHCVALSSATSGLVLAARCMGLDGEVILPSFTFVATGLPLAWCGLRPVFVDVDPQTYNVDPALVEAAITPRTSAIIAVHVYGNPADEAALAAIAERHNLRLMFDAAHGIGARYRGRQVGATGDAQVFSLSPTKLATSGEGGLVATDDAELAENLRLARNYGQPGDYLCRFAGLNARLSEVHAVIALHTLSYVEEGAVHRNRLGARYQEGLEGIPGLSFPRVNPLDRHSYKDFTVRVEEAEFGLSRDALRQALEARGIATRPYFDPPLHRQVAIGLDMSACVHPLPHTERLAAEVLSPPMFSEMTPEQVDTVVAAIRSTRDGVGP